MKFRNFGLVFSLSLTFSSNLLSWSPNDLVIVYEVPHHNKQVLFNEVIAPAVPGKTAPDPYHVTLMWVENMDPQHRQVLKTHLEGIRNQHAPQAQFTVDSAGQLTNGFIRPKGTIVLTPNHQETQQFKNLNSLLYAEVQQFNLQHNTAYTINSYTDPRQYKPHVTIVKTNHIMNNNLNTATVIQDVNLNLVSYNSKNGAPLGLLQGNQPASVPQPTPVPMPQAAPTPLPKKNPQVKRRAVRNAKVKKIKVTKIRKKPIRQVKQKSRMNKRIHKKAPRIKRIRSTKPRIIPKRNKVTQRKRKG